MADSSSENVTVKWVHPADVQVLLRTIDELRGMLVRAEVELEKVKKEKQELADEINELNQWAETEGPAGKG